MQKKFSQRMVAMKLVGGGLKQSEVAELFGVHYSHINKMVASSLDPEIGYERFKRLAERLHLSQSDLERMGTDPDYMPPVEAGHFPTASGRLALAGV